MIPCRSINNMEERKRRTVLATAWRGICERGGGREGRGEEGNGKCKEVESSVGSVGMLEAYGEWNRVQIRR